MLDFMRTTVRLDPGLMDSARAEARRRGTTVTALIEEGLRHVLRRDAIAEPRRPVTLLVCRAGGGTLPGVDLDDSAATLDRLEGR